METNKVYRWTVELCGDKQGIQVDSGVMWRQTRYTGGQWSYVETNKVYRWTVELCREKQGIQVDSGVM